MEILMGYGVGPQKERILQYYWDLLSMVFRVGRYYGTHFKRNQGVTQGDPLSPTNFNMVVEVVIIHWFTVMAGEEAGTYGFGQAVQ